MTEPNETIRNRVELAIIGQTAGKRPANGKIQCPICVTHMMAYYVNWVGNFWYACDNLKCASRVDQQDVPECRSNPRPDCGFVKELEAQIRFLKDELGEAQRTLGVANAHAVDLRAEVEMLKHREVDGKQRYADAMEAYHRLKDKIDSSVEVLAHVEHERWGHWMAYLFTKGHVLENGAFVIYPECVTRWRRQAVTKYADLSEKEKESDRVEVRKTLAALRTWCYLGEG